MTYKELKQELIQASNSYYKNNTSLMTDYEFDMKLKELEKMEKEQGFADPDSPTQKPGSDIVNNTTLKHERPMLSLENTYNKEDIEKWYNDIIKMIGKKDFSVVVDCKWDGGSAAIRYKNNSIILALTRGNGIEGEDITQNVKILQSYWNKKSFSGEARGELIITKDGFKELNSDGRYQNARNLLSGSMKLLDPRDFEKRKKYIKFYAYWLENSKNELYSEDLEELKKSGFDVGDYFICKNLDEIYSAIEKIHTMTLDCEIDGAVLKLNEKKYWDQIGSTAKFPRWAKAYKYQQEVVETTITDITFDVGKTGKISVLAWFEPRFIDGSTITKATLNNKDFYEKMNIAVGDVVSIQKAACIIPQIVSVVSRPKNRKVIKFPEVCPSCGSKLSKHNEEQTDVFCDNKNCKNKIIALIENYTHSIECDGFAEIIIERLYDNNLLKSIADLYELKNHKEEIAKLDRLSLNIAEKLCQNVEKTKSAEFWKVLSGLGIPNIGQKMAKILTQKFNSIEALMNADEIKLTSTEDIAEITAKGIIDYFSDEENKKLISKLLVYGVNLRSESKKQNNILEGKSFCITGALSKPRKEFEVLIEANGGKLIDSVSSKTSYLITNDKNSGSSKNRKAQELNIPILNEVEFLELLK